MFGGHGPVRVLTAKRGKRSSSNLTTRQMLAGIRKLKSAQNQGSE